MTTDVSTFVGAYPFRAVPDTSPAFLLREMDRVGIERAWVGHLPSAFLNDPAAGSHELVRLLDPHLDRLRPVPTVDPNLPLWREDLRMAVDVGAPAIRTYPAHQGGDFLADLSRAAAAAGLAIVMTVRFEDARQRHPLDTAGDLSPAAVRIAVRAHPDARVLVAHAGREFIEEVHYTLTGQEAARVRWDVSWIWGPPFDDLKHLVETIGVEPFVFGTGLPLRLPDATVAKLELSDLDATQLAAVQDRNLERWLRPSQ